MDATKYVWWILMSNYQEQLSKLLQLTEDMYQQVQSIKSTMKDNEPEQLEDLQSFVEQREECLKQLDSYIDVEGFKWSEQDKEVIGKLRKYQEEIQPIMTHLHHSFTSQIHQLTQRKQMSQKYANAYKVISTDGSFIDQRK